jgi:hypothetical protein
LPVSEAGFGRRVYELPAGHQRGFTPTIDRAVADACGKLVARREAVGRPIEAMDAFIAATAEVHQLILVTRNTPDFHSALKDVVNPWG